MTSDVPVTNNSSPSGSFDTPMAKIIVSAVVVVVGLLFSAVLYSDQADLYDSSFALAIVRQITAETAFQPFFLIASLVPIFLAAARNTSWLALAAGGLILLSVLMPYARFEYIDVTTGEIDGAHNSLYQLAGPGHHMPTFVSVLFLMLLAGVTAMFWRVRIGGLIAVMGAITTAFVWPTVFDEPPVIDDSALIIFPSKSLLFGYYIAWFGAVIAVIGEASIVSRLFGRDRSDDAAADAATD